MTKTLLAFFLASAISARAGTNELQVRAGISIDKKASDRATLQVEMLPLELNRSQGVSQFEVHASLRYALAKKWNVSPVLTAGFLNPAGRHLFWYGRAGIVADYRTRVTPRWSVGATNQLDLQRRNSELAARERARLEFDWQRRGETKGPYYYSGAELVLGPTYKASKYGLFVGAVWRFNDRILLDTAVHQEQRFRSSTTNLKLVLRFRV